MPACLLLTPVPGRPSLPRVGRGAERRSAPSPGWAGRWGLRIPRVPQCDTATPSGSVLCVNKRPTPSPVHLGGGGQGAGRAKNRPGVHPARTGANPSPETGPLGPAGGWGRCVEARIQAQSVSIMVVGAQPATAPYRAHPGRLSGSSNSQGTRGGAQASGPAMWTAIKSACCITTCRPGMSIDRGAGPVTSRP